MVRILVLAVVVSSCGPPCTVEGRYRVRQSRSGGSTCPRFQGETDPFYVRVTRVSGTAVSVVTEGVSGDCEAKLSGNGCVATSECAFYIDGDPVALERFRYTFSDSGFSGASDQAFGPPLLDDYCDVSYSVQGTRQ